MYRSLKWNCQSVMTIIGRSDAGKIARSGDHRKFDKCVWMASNSVVPQNETFYTCF
jgi:hypothetical protein